MQGFYKEVKPTIETESGLQFVQDNCVLPNPAKSTVRAIVSGKAVPYDPSTIPKLIDDVFKPQEITWLEEPIFMFSPRSYLCKVMGRGKGWISKLYFSKMEEGIPPNMDLEVHVDEMLPPK